MEITNSSSPFLPGDIVYEIFLRLPAKSLLRFRLASKTWCDIIDGLSFANNHIAFAAEQPTILPVALPFPTGVQSLHSLIFDGNTIAESDHPVLQFSNNKSYVVRHIAYGLLLFQNLNCRAETFLCNPLRGEVLELPRATPTEKHLDWYGMGFDSTINAYKIVRVFQVIPDHTSSVGLTTEIYTMGTSSSWRKISSIPPYFLGEYGVSAYGDMHWSRSWIDLYSDRTSITDHRMIISFDFKKEEFVQILQPDQLGGLINGYIKLITLKESLAIIDLSSDYQFTQFIEIWVMEDYNKKEWIRKYRIRDKLYIIYPNFSVGAWGPSIFLDPNNLSDKLYILDLKMNGITSTICPWKDVNSFTRTKIFSYTGSILSLKNFGKLVSAAEGRRFSFLKTARLIYVCP